MRSSVALVVPIAAFWLSLAAPAAGQEVWDDIVDEGAADSGVVVVVGVRGMNLDADDSRMVADLISVALSAHPRLLAVSAARRDLLPETLPPDCRFSDMLLAAPDVFANFMFASAGEQSRISMVLAEAETGRILHRAHFVHEGPLDLVGAARVMTRLALTVFELDESMDPATERAARVPAAAIDAYRAALALDHAGDWAEALNSYREAARIGAAAFGEAERAVERTERIVGFLESEDGACVEQPGSI